MDCCREMVIAFLKRAHCYLIVVHSINGSRRVWNSLWDWAVRYRQKRRMLAFYSQFIKAGDLVFDLGANRGNRTEVFIKLGACTIAVEPNPKCAKSLRKKHPNAIIVEKAVGDCEGQGTMRIHSKRSEISTLSQGWYNKMIESYRADAKHFNNYAVVNVTTLDSLIKEYGVPVFCKIDVEGYEHKVIAGLSTPIKALSWEFQPIFPEPALGALEKLIAMGYKEFNYSIGESMKLKLPVWVDAEKIRYILEKHPKKAVFGDVYARCM